MRMEFTLKYIINSILLVFALSSVANAAPSRMNTTDTEPATCTVGDLWIDTNGTAGNSVYTCTATDTWTLLDTRHWVAQATAPADTTLLWFDTDQVAEYVVLKVYTGGKWVPHAVGSSDTPSGSATYPSAAGVANWNGSAWGTSYTVGTAANNLVQLNGSAQLPAVSADLLTVTDTNNRFTTDTVGAALVQIGEFNAALPSLVFGTGLTLAEDTPSAGTDTVSVSANTYQAYDADWLGITPNGAALVSAANYAAMQTLLDIDDIQTLTGIAAGTAHLGTFTGTTIADSSTIKTALQSLETSVETRAPSANPVFTASAAIPQGSSPTVDAAGEIAIDLTSDQLIYYGGAKRILTYKKQIDFAVKTPVDADDFLLLKAQTAMEITDIHVIAQGGTSISVDVQECDSAGANCATVDAAITATTTGAEDDGEFSNGTIDAGDWVKVVLGAPSGTVDYLAGSIYYVEIAD